MITARKRVKGIILVVSVCYSLRTWGLPSTEAGLG